MKTQKMLGRMIEVSSRQHTNQFDKGGVPYILHCLQVMHNLKSKDEELCCIAVGHDLLEDTNMTPEWLKLLGFTPRIIDGIVALTKLDGESYDTYKDRVKGNPDACRVKMADLRHNSDISRLKCKKGGIQQRDIDRAEKYFRFYLELLQIVEQETA